MSISNLVKIFGIVPSDPEESIPIKVKKSGTTQVIVDSFTQYQTNILYTVTTGKTLYLCSIFYGFYMGIAGTLTVYVRDTADVTKYKLRRQDTPIAVSLAVSDHFSPPLEIPPGYDIVGESGSNSLAVTCTFFGWEE